MLLELSWECGPVLGLLQVPPPPRHWWWGRWWYRVEIDGDLFKNALSVHPGTCLAHGRPSIDT